ncbi:pseudouridine synthase [Defluviimonas sp. WL0002]|uniref:Pseudouridine synthase n=1 Tax=Albidovulum marisflavi TaxID=2984159 RepID=A0ABT2ZAG7_9RHOB|nr:pseudouridine synthase [Defluviimonas sp. WL0002]MCV2868086.1 pseudouridine synthase [Defluviimonas sp. WL0002]
MTEDAKQGERIAKVMARSGVASRRDAERMILEGRVKVNGKPVTSPALDVLASDKVTLDGQPIDAPQPARVWLYYKPLGLVTSEKDEKGRQTVFDTLPDGLPRVMSVGRLDLNSEGLLLLTNDGELKRRLELPSTGWLRKYRVRVNGRPNDMTFDPLRRGVTIEGEEFLPMEITLDKQQGANAWLTVGLREGKNREIRRAMTEVNLIVNRLIRVSYGPFRLNQMKPGEVIEVKRKVLREQLGSLFDGLAGTDGGDGSGERTQGGRAGARRGPAPERRGDDRTSSARGKSFARSAGPRDGDSGRSFADRPDRKPRTPRAEGDAPRKPRFDKGSAPRNDGDRENRPYRAKEPRDGDSGRSFADRPDRKPRTPRAEGDAPRKPRFDKGSAPRNDGDRENRPYRAKGPRDGDTGQSGWKPRADRQGGSEGRSDQSRPWQRSGGSEGASGKPKWEGKPGGDSARGPRKPWSDAPRDREPRPDYKKPRSDRAESAPKPRQPRGSTPRRGPKKDD